MTNVNKIAYLGSDFFHNCFESLLNGSCNIEWLFITKMDDKYEFNDLLISLAKKTNITIIDQKINRNHIEMLRTNGCDLIISAAYPHKIPIIENMPQAVNIHPALLPIGRGAWPMPYFILKDLKNAGVTLHKLSKDFDAGDILIQDSFPVLPVENIESLSCKMQMLAQRLLMQFMENIDFYWDNASPQIGGEYWPVPSDDERTLNWDLSHIEIDRVVRAFGKCESYAIFDNKKWFVRGVTTWAESHNSTPGTIVHRTNKEVVLACSDGYVCIRFYQPIDTDLDNNN